MSKTKSFFFVLAFVITPIISTIIACYLVFSVFADKNYLLKLMDESTLTERETNSLKSFRKKHDAYLAVFDPKSLDKFPLALQLNKEVTITIKPTITRKDDGGVIDYKGSETDRVLLQFDKNCVYGIVNYKGKNYMIEPIFAVLPDDLTDEWKFGDFKSPHIIVNCDRIEDVE